MTYLQFHLLFSFPALAVTFFLARRKVSRVHFRWLAIICGIVLVFTTPWDNYAVATGIWDFGEDKVLFRILHLPVEEYGFFFLQTLIVGLLTVAMLRPRPEEKIR
jgi:putative membrane protein